MALIVRDKYGIVEFNHLASQRTGQIHAQLPATSTEFSGADEMVENGMLLVYDRVGGEILKPTDITTDIVLLHKSAEKEYNEQTPGLKNFALAPDSKVYPRLYRLEENDVYTTNCIDPSANVAAGDILVPSTTGVMTKATNQATGDDARVQLRVIKLFTVPDGQAAVKVEVIKA